MPKGKKKNYNATKLFLQNQSVSSCKSGANSFSQAVVGASKENRKSSWPLLTPEENISSSLAPTQDNPLLTDESTSAPRQTARESQERNMSCDTGDIDSAEKSFSTSPLMNVEGSINYSQFPSLSDSFNKIKWKEKSLADSSVVSKFNMNAPDASLLNITRYSKKPKPKKNDPLQIDLVSALEATLLKKFRKNRPIVGHRKPKRETNHGNILDASKPIQKKKGKVRPNRKKKLTSLRKLMIAAKMEKESVSSYILSSLSNQVSSLSLSVEQMAKDKIHSNKFRHYCTNLVTKELNDCVKSFLVQIRIFQDKMFLKNEVKARAKRRYVCGFHECKKLIKAGLIKLVIIASNIEKNEALNIVVKDIVTECETNGITVVFACKCQHLSGCLYKKNRVCVVGILNYEGAEDLYNKMISLLEVEKSNYQTLLKSIMESSNINSDIQDKSVEEMLVSNMLEKLKEDEEDPLETTPQID